MAAQKGDLVLLKQGGTTIAGLRATSLVINNTMVDVTTKDSSAKRTLLAGAGIQSMSISADGVFTDAAIEETIRGFAAADSINTFLLLFPNGDDFTGSFQITSYERAGSVGGEETFSITLESSGTIAYTAV